MRQNWIIALPLLALLAACATPQEYCIARATEELRKVERLIEDVSRDLARGYTLRTETYSRRVWRVCSVSRDADGKITARNFCWDRETYTRQVPEAIDPTSERRKLAGLESRRATLARNAEPAIAACRAAHPE